MSSLKAYPSTRIAEFVDMGDFFFFLFITALIMLEDLSFLLHCIVEGTLFAVLLLCLEVVSLSSMLLGGMFSLLLAGAAVSGFMVRTFFLALLPVVFVAVTRFFLGILC